MEKVKNGGRSGTFKNAYDPFKLFKQLSGVN
jgi:hypothetical protein